jgi:hypothetical protein
VASGVRLWIAYVDDAKLGVTQLGVQLFWCEQRLGGNGASGAQGHAQAHDQGIQTLHVRSKKNNKVDSEQNL